VELFFVWLAVVEKKENAMNKFLLVVLFVFGSFVYTMVTDPSFAAQVQTAAVASGADPQADMLEGVKWIGYAVLAGLGLWAVIKVINSEIFIPILSIFCLIGIVLGATYLWTYGDKNGDAKEDNQIIAVVQPVGSPDVDAQYAEINQANTKSNFVSIASIILFIFVLLIAFVVTAGIGVVLHHLSRNKKDVFSK